jgi:hypothetical protein
MCDVSDEHGERFHQEISEMESRYKGKPSPSLLADYCWTLVRDSKSSHRRSNVMKHFWDCTGKTILYTFNIFLIELTVNIALYMTRTYSIQIEVSSSKDYLC